MSSANKALIADAFKHSRKSKICPPWATTSHSKPGKPLLLDRLRYLQKPKSRTLREAMSHQSDLVQLPFELILKVVGFLPHASKKALSFTCRRFFKCRDSLYFEALFSELDRFDFLCMLERDRAISKFACAGCKAAHIRSSFPPGELNKASVQRHCMRTKPMLWICPFQLLSFEDVQDIQQLVREDPTLRFTDGDVITIPCTHDVLLTGGEHDFVVYKGEDRLSAVNYVLILTTKLGDVPPRSRIETALRVSNLQMCPHMQLGDSRVTRLYNPLDWHTEGSHDTVKCTQADCDTIIEFIYESTDQDLTLFLGFHRYLGQLKSPNDPVWLSQLIYPNSRLMKHQFSVGMAKLKAIQKLEYNKSMCKETKYRPSRVDENVYWDTRPQFSLVWPHGRTTGSPLAPLQLWCRRKHSNLRARWNPIKEKIEEN